MLFSGLKYKEMSLFNGNLIFYKPKRNKNLLISPDRSKLTCSADGGRISVKKDKSTAPKNKKNNPKIKRLPG